MELKNKNILVVGLGVTGVATARFLKNRGASVTVTDQKKEQELKAFQPLIVESGIRMEFGQHRIETFEKTDIIVISPGVPHTIEPILKAKERGIPVLGEIELASRFIAEPIIAVTGTNGKTTTTTLLGKMLEDSGLKVFVGGNIGNPLIAYADREEKAEIVVIEVSSFQLDTIDTFRAKVAVLLNITEDHMDRYPDLDAYAKSKSRIFKNQQYDDTAVLNGSDPVVRSLSRNILSRKVFFSSKEEKGVTISDESIISQENMSRLLADFKLPGKHNIENAAAASLAALAAGGTFEGVWSALRKFKGLSHRLEYIDTLNGVDFFNDSKATNVDSVARALETFERPVVLIMGGRNKGSKFHALRDLIDKHTKELIVIGEAKEDIKAELGNIKPVETATTMEEAVFKAYNAAKPGDIVLLSPACASFDMYNSYAQRGEDFCRSVANLNRTICYDKTTA
ncbi:MAG: UDP-N-acetylmuramoyl-L-alanine--D-glutamate ligase [Proteobacteria bacterium]|nr:UDP-N-acetylmuramoyl-L-alanine--D-glutamate ligase [Pseudomonadota bacterium]MCG2757242.1 UDP-N-acetylmuramoyl-L-alanine--D-glutamate ligase [Desulfobacteraceae bacterium]MBU4259456.1 UDP-N-acetylmuramoyl-L-alanine--D-glutamate ligase [Pseudomonadota bacterium]MBU4287851.1 UDP-N-acetylmuramoyl-L-alanine--D-glutamate ligase [Pseudomonadota bacterium]MBU4414930.1 UDP-N-acetylmuramoyl-L-alanine--D-glutamate ligase [Pseudomonadota bacterium]